MLVDTQSSVSIPKTQILWANGNLNFITLKTYIYTVTPGLLTSVSIEYEWDDGVSLKNDTFNVPLMLNNSKSFFLALRQTATTDVKFSTTLIGTGTYGLSIAFDSQ